MGCFLEITAYLLIQLLTDRVTEEKCFDTFKELLLRHAVQRPPHSLAIFNLDDVKNIEEFMQKTFFRHFEMFKYALTIRDMLVLTTEPIFTQKDSELKSILEGKEVHPREMEDLRQFLSTSEEEAIQREIDYYTKGLGKLESILNEEMGKLQTHLEDRIKKQDDDFIQKVAPGKK